MSTIDRLYQRINTLVERIPDKSIQLTKMDIREDHADWFARCCATYLNWFQHTLMSFSMIACALLFSGYGNNLAIWAGIFAIHGYFAYLKKHQDKKMADTEGGGHLANLNRILLRLNVSDLLQVGFFVFAILNAPAEAFGPLVALCMFNLWFGCIGLVSTPHISVIRLIVVTGALSAAFLARGGLESVAAGLLIIPCSIFYYGLIYNLYYLFATRRLRTRILRESNETVNLLLKEFDENASDWLWQTDKDGRFTQPSPRFLESSGMTRKELEQNSLFSLLTNGAELAEVQQTIAAEENFNEVVVPLQINEERRWWSISGQAIYQKDGSFYGYRGVATDITKTKQAEATIDFLAHHDVLTGLPNRSMFTSILKRALERRAEDRLVAILYVDLDNFKSVNDTYGNLLGDKLLKQTANRLEQIIGPSDYASRLGADEFAVMLTDLSDPIQALGIANRLSNAIDQKLMIDGEEVSIGASIGIAVGPMDGDNAEQLLRNADLALYDAKLHGRNGISIFNEDMQENMRQRRLLGLDLRQAISRGELSMEYQPIINIEDKQTIGYEALMRWHHPVRGQVPPDKFIQIAEEMGLIVQIGEWALRESLAEAARWPEHLSVAVNVSPAQVKSTSLLTTLAHALAQSGVSPNRLELEITENVLIQDAEGTLEILQKIQRLGIKISLDDFGTGYSSLNYLRSFPFDKIKIDRCFVSGLVERDQSKAIINAVIGLASDLNMVTTAEGVETAKQFDMLKRQGCSQVQGFLFSKAVPPSQLNFERKPAAHKTKQSNVLHADQKLQIEMPEEQPARGNAPDADKRKSA